MELFKTIVADVWRQRNLQRLQRQGEIAKQKAILDSKKQRLLDLLVEGTIQQSDYDTQTRKVGTALQV